MASDLDSFKLIECRLIVAPVVELGGAGGGMGGHGGGFFEDTAIFEIVGDAGCSEAVIADPCGDAGGPGAAIDHLSGIAVGQRSVAQRLGDAIDARKERGLGKAAQTCHLEIFGEIGIQSVVTGGRHGPCHLSPAVLPKADDCDVRCPRP